MQNLWYAKCINFLSQVCYICMVPGVWSKMIGYAMWYAMAIAYKLFVHSFSLLKSLFFFFFFVWPLMRNAQTKIAIVYMREQSCDTRDDMMIPKWYGMYAMEGVDQWSLMCTSNVAGNTQWLVSIGKWRKMGQGLSKLWQEWMYNGIPRYQGDIEVTVLAYG